MSFTITDLRTTIDDINDDLISQGCNAFIVEQGRNGYQAADLYKVNEDGGLSCQFMVGGGTSREVNGYCIEEKWRVLLRSKDTINRKQAKKLLDVYGIDFSKDFHQVSSLRHGGVLKLFAKLTGYRKPHNANGSQNRYFYCHLQNKVKIN